MKPLLDSWLAAVFAAAIVLPAWSQNPAREASATNTDEGADTATHREIEPLPVSFQSLTALRMDRDGNLLAADAEAQDIKIISPAGKLMGVLKPGFGPEAMDVAADGSIFCGGQGRLAHLDKSGRVLLTAKVPSDIESPVSETSRRRAEGRAPQLSGMAVTDRALFVAFGSGWSMGSKSKLFRFDLNLANPKRLAEDLRGCCQRCDLAARNGVLYLAENAVHRVVCYDFDGKMLNRWGERGRTGLEGFGSCCNPMNLAFDARGVLYTAESGLGRVKRHTTDGKYLGLVGYVGVERFQSAGRLAASCSNIAIAVSANGDRVYVLDIKSNLIRVLQKKA